MRSSSTTRQDIRGALTAERGRAQVLADLMKFKFGVKSIQSMSEGQIERETNFLDHISSTAIFIAEDRPKSLNSCLVTTKGTKVAFHTKGNESPINLFDSRFIQTNWCS